MALILLLILTAFTTSAADPAPAKPQLVILKVDDFNRTPRWQRFATYIQTNHLKASIGIICNVYEKDNPALISWTKELAASGTFDFWHHGYDHRLNWKEGDQTLSEFKGTSYEHQKEHLAKGCALVEQKLGIRFLAFGAPGNSVDATTARVLGERPDIKVIFYGPANVPGKLLLDRWINLETPTFRPNSEAFIKAYPSRATKPVLAIQGHPNQWTDKDFAEFEKIVTFLRAKNTKFVTTAEAYEALRP
ncbi:MAG: DUF2334 domain-containing protein [Verrucomicrobiota bacterium]